MRIETVEYRCDRCDNLLKVDPGYVPDFPEFNARLDCERMPYRIIKFQHLCNGCRDQIIAILDQYFTAKPA